jgi:hypothetical protein
MPKCAASWMLLLMLCVCWATRPVFLIRYSLSRLSLRAPRISLSAISQLHRVLPMHYGALHLMLLSALRGTPRCNDCSNVCMHVSKRGAFTIFQCSSAPFICFLIALNRSGESIGKIPDKWTMITKRAECIEGSCSRGAC